MCSDILKCIVFFGVFFGCVIGITTGMNSICKVDSECILLKDCTPYMNLIRILEKPLKASVVDFLRARECGFQEGYPKVCCTFLPDSLHIWKYATSTSKPRRSKSRIEFTKPLPSTSLTDNMDRRTTVKPPRSNLDKLKEKSDAINNAFDLSDLFDFTGSFDLFRRRRLDSNSSLDIEIR